MQEAEEEDWERDLSLPQPAPEWRHFVTQLNQDPRDGSTVDSGLGTITIEEEDVKADTARDEEVKGGDGEAVIDVTLNANATDNLVWNENDPYFEIDDESSGVHRIPVAALTPLSAPTEETPLAAFISRQREASQGNPYCGARINRCLDTRLHRCPSGRVH